MMTLYSILGTVKFTQPLHIPKLWEEYGSLDGPASHMPAVAGQVLAKRDDEGTVSDTKAKMCWAAVATCKYIMQWSCPNQSQ